MHCQQEISQGLYWIGGDDKRQRLFEGIHPTPNGMSYNSYLLIDDHTVLFDAIDRVLEERFLKTIDSLLGERALEYIVVSHMEPDHSATLLDVARRHTQAVILCTKTCRTLIKQFFGDELDHRVRVVSDGVILNCGKHTLSFATAPMVHWPEVMVTYCIEDKILFSADAFGTFGTLDGKLDDENLFFDEMLPEMRRYYANIVGKYGTQVSELLAKASTLEINTIAPLHGPIIKHHVSETLAIYEKWARYEPEEKAVTIAYASAYGGTRDAAEQLAFALSDLGLHDFALFDLSVDHYSYALAEMFRTSNVVLASITYNARMHPAMEALMSAIESHNLRDRKFSIIQNGSWGPIAGKLIAKELENVPGASLVGDMVTIKSHLAPGQNKEIRALAQAIVDSLDSPVPNLSVEVEEVAKASLPPLAGATKAPAPIPVHPGIHLTPPPLPKTDVAPADPVKKTAAEELRERSLKKAGLPTGEQIVNVWRCTFCGYQFELAKGISVDNLQCPQCFKNYPGLFMLVREKVVRA